MANLVIYIFLLTVFHSLLFFDNSLGINVLLFNMILLIFLIYSLVINRKDINKKGLLFILPIILLSSTYFIYNNIFREFNVIILPILYLLMYIYTFNPVYNFNSIIKNMFSLIFKPLNCIGKFYTIVRLNNNIKISKTKTNKIKSFIIVIPIVIIVILLLGSADMMFNEMFSGIIEIFKNLSLDNIVSRTIRGFILFTYLGASLNYLIFSYRKQNHQNNHKKNIDLYTMKLLFSALNVIYIVFDIIQIKSLLLHQVSSNIVYSEYAREGFFQLLVISLFNIFILIISKWSKEDNYIKFSSVLMVFLNFIIISSSFLRMYMYEAHYGYTLLRLLVYLILITEVLLLIPTICYIFNSKVKILKHYMIITVSMYTLFNLLPVDYIIAYRNINRYYDTNKLDIEYLENDYTDNISLLINLYYKTTDQKLRNELKNYLRCTNNNIEINNFFEYNLSKKIALDNLNNNDL